MTHKLTSARYWHSHHLELLTEHDIIVLDIDGVIISPTQYLGSIPWFTKHREKYKTQRPIPQLVQELKSTSTKTGYVTVAPELIDHVNQLADDRLVILLTAREFEIAEETHRLVSSTGLKFNKISHDPHLYQGIIFVGFNDLQNRANDKGKALLHYLDKIGNKQINSIVFIDDSLRNIENTSAALKNHTNIKFHGIHFTKELHDLHEQYSHDELDKIAEVQLLMHKRGFDILPSNDLALALYEECAANLNSIDTTKLISSLVTS